MGLPAVERDLLSTHYAYGCREAAESALDVRELQRLIAEQQASLGRLQQLVSEAQLGPSTVDTSST
jgi:hypothetical protein